MARHFKIDDVLEKDDLESFRALMRQPAMTIDGLCEWLGVKGYRISRSSVGGYRQNFNKVLEDVRRSSEMAGAFVQMAKNSGGAELAGASLSRFQQLLMEKLMSLSSEQDGVDAGELMKLSIALKTAVGAQQGIEELRLEFAKKQKEAVAEAEKMAKAGGSPVDVVSKVREILGIK